MIKETKMKIRFFNRETGETVGNDKFYVVGDKGEVYEFSDFTGTTAPFFTRRVYDIGWELVNEGN